MNFLKIAETLNAIDLSDRKTDEIQHINKVEVIYRNFGKYGLNGLVFRDDKGKFFVIRKRNSNLFYFA